MGSMNVTEAAKLVFTALAPIIATGMFAEAGDDITEAAKEIMIDAWAVVERRLEVYPKAVRALDLYREDPADLMSQQMVEAQIADVYKGDPDELLALAQVITALQPPGRAGQGDAGSGSADSGRSNGAMTARVGEPAGRPSGSSARPNLPATLSADGTHFTFGYALIIGVGSYKHTDLSVPGGTTANDARALAALLRDPQLAAYPDDQVRVLVDARATRTNILDELEALAKRAYGGTALIFFAGHGESVGDSYALLPYDADLANLAGTAITADLFQQRVAKVRASTQRLVVLLNCCHAGAVGGAALNAAPDLLSGAAPPADFYQPLAAASGQAVISASRPTQMAGARSKARPQHTPFGAQLLEGLRGKAPGEGVSVSALDLFAYLRAQVPADAKHIWHQGSPLRQEPLFYASQLDDDIPLALRPRWQSVPLGDAAVGLSRRLAELELAADKGALSPTQAAERDELLRRVGGH